MAKKEERFEVTFRDGSQLKDEGVRQILVDKETGVNYLCWKSGYGAAITPLLDSEGKVIVPFIIGIIIDIQYQGIGCWIAWGIWLIMFVLLLIDRHKRER